MEKDKKISVQLNVTQLKEISQALTELQNNVEAMQEEVIGYIEYSIDDCLKRINKALREVGISEDDLPEEFCM